LFGIELSYYSLSARYAIQLNDERILKKILIGLISLLVLIAAAVFAYFSATKSPQIFEPSVAMVSTQTIPELDPSSVRHIQTGKVQGFSDSYNTQAWLGIPYAAAPTGELRWRSPQAAPEWTGVRNALQYGAACTQFWGILAAEDGVDGDLVGSEDCLTLNIWSPSLEPAELRNKKIPVMFWIHGGGNDSGTANLYQAHHLAGSKNVIVVLVNYRVGLMGWFSHDAIRANADNLEDASGNFGTLDLIAALRWVNRNVSAFGGDPNNVTIFGESAGGRNVFSLLASPLAKGLFHRAISQSGSADTTLLTLAEDFADDRSSKAVFGLENSSNSLIYMVLSSLYPQEGKAEIRARIKQTPPSELLEIMRSQSARKLMQLASDNLGQPGYTKIARVVRDGHVISNKSTLSLLEDSKSYNDVPIMLGSNRDENKVFMLRDPEHVKWHFGMLPRVIDPPRYERISQYVSENWKAGAVDEPAKRILRSGDNQVFAYRFDWDDEPVNWLADLKQLLGATHGFEISHVFGDFEGGVPIEIIGSKQNAPGRKALALSMMDYWAAFAHNGDPARGLSGKQTLWTPWRANGANIMLLDSPSGGGTRMSEVRTNVRDIKAKISQDEVIKTQKDRCHLFAALFLHGYQASDFWDENQYQSLGCEAFPAGEFRQG
jgi:para-nitrobenzyl esterase